MGQSHRAARALLILAVAALALPAAALASRAPTTKERTALVRGALGAGYPARCTYVRVSTAVAGWGAVGPVQMQPTRANRAFCTARGRVFDGVTFLHRQRGRWRFVTAGSSVEPSECRKLPARVRDDLFRFTEGLGCP